MAGRGSRLRPHSLTTPKPLISVAGLPIVHQIINTIAKAVKSRIEEVAFILGDPAFFGTEIEKNLIEAAKAANKKKITTKMCPCIRMIIIGFLIGISSK